MNPGSDIVDSGRHESITQSRINSVTSPARADEHGRDLVVAELTKNDRRLPASVADALVEFPEELEVGPDCVNANSLGCETFR